MCCDGNSELYNKNGFRFRPKSVYLQLNEVDNWVFLYLKDFYVSNKDRTIQIGLG